MLSAVSQVQESCGNVARRSRSLLPSLPQDEFTTAIAARETPSWSLDLSESRSMRNQGTVVISNDKHPMTCSCFPSRYGSARGADGCRGTVSMLLGWPMTAAIHARPYVPSSGACSPSSPSNLVFCVLSWDLMTPNACAVTYKTPEFALHLLIP